MGAFINDVTITISRGTLSLQQRSFDPLIVGSGVPVGQSGVIDVAELSDLTTEGYLTTDEEYKMVSAVFAQSPRPEICRVYRKPTATAYVDALTTLQASDQAWYALCIQSRTKSDLQAVGAWANSNGKMFIGCSSDETVLASRNYDREAYIIHDAPADYPDCAWVGKCISQQPGSLTWKWKVLTGQVAANYTLTQLNTIRTDHGQAIQEQAGASFVNEGMVTSGEYIDVIQGQDWVEDQIKTGLLSLFLNNGKIPLDDTGIARVKAVVSGVLKRAGDYGIIAAAISDADLALSDDKKYMYQVTAPQRSEISSANLTARTLPDVKFVYYLAGAIHKTTVTGYITA
jgi:hypothetical protein